MKLLTTMTMLTLCGTGCASWMPGEATTLATSCSPAQTWSAALASLREFELRRADEARGVIETEWIAVPSSRLSGLTNRDINEERARFVLTLDPASGRSVLTIKQIREFWSPQGVQSRSWRQIPGNSEQEHQLAARIHGQLKRASC